MSEPTCAQVGHNPSPFLERMLYGSNLTQRLRSYRAMDALDKQPSLVKGPEETTCSGGNDDTDNMRADSDDDMPSLETDSECDIHSPKHRKFPSLPEAFSSPVSFVSVP